MEKIMMKAGDRPPRECEPGYYCAPEHGAWDRGFIIPTPPRGEMALMVFDQILDVFLFGDGYEPEGLDQGNFWDKGGYYD